MRKPTNLTDQVFDRLTVTGQVRSPETGRYFLTCNCSCGSTDLVISKQAVTSGRTRSCGCLHRESTIARSTKHGMSKTATYANWQAMIARCHNPSYSKYPYYGGRGIRVCKRWHKFENFLADMGEKPQGMTLDRIKNHKAYSKKNCRWATRVQQQNNMRSNRIITVDGIRHTMAEWTRIYGYPRSLINNRLQKGWTELDAVTTPWKPSGRRSCSI